MICASIDIGTNTLLLLVAEVDNGKIVKVIADKHQIARLGEGLNQSGVISEKATERAIKILEEYKNIIENNNVELVRASATSAMRDAKNSAEVKRLFSEVLGYEIEIINGEEEARISYLGSTENQLNKTEIVLDIGGGSAEVIVGVNGKIEYSKSLQIGAVRTTEQFFPTFEAKTQNYAIARNYIKVRLSELNEVNFDGDIIAVAGTPTTIAAIDLNLPQYNAHLIHNHRIELARLDQIIELFKTYTSMELVEKYNVHPNRADVILGGALILKEFTDYAKKDSFVVSCKGLRYGLILDLFKK